MTKNKLRILATIILVCVIGSTLVAQPFAGGDGTESNPYQITSAKELDSIRHHLSDYFILMNDIDLDVSPYNSDNGWNPIGGYYVPFTGNFNGKAFKIKNLFINRQSTDYIGLFGSIENATIDSIGIVHCDIKGKQNVGGIIGIMKYSSKLQNSYSTGTIQGKAFVGGLVGFVNRSNIYCCYSTVDVTAQNSAGGLVGSSNVEAGVRNSYSTGTIIGEGGNRGYIGGLMGVSASTNEDPIEFCYSIGLVDGDPENGVGGLIGYTLGGRISYCFYDSIRSKQNDVGKGIPKLTSDLKMQSTFLFWDFDSIWEFTETDDYPSLQGVYEQHCIVSPDKGFVKKSNTFSYQVEIKKRDASKPFTYSLSNEPTGMSISNQGVVTWIPSETGTFTYSIQVQDAKGIVATQENTIQVNFFEGEGTTSDPFLVYNVTDLDNIRDYYHQHFKLMADIDLDISPYNSGEGWNPIGYYTDNLHQKRFNGSFNGNGHSIKNLFINRPTSNFIGLFGYAGGKIYDLKLENCLVRGQNQVGALIGQSYYANIYKCCSSGNIDGGISAGGLIGIHKYSSTINCYSNCIVTGTHETGGLIGACYESEIEHCYAIGAISGNTFIGGLLGKTDNNSTISYCYYDSETTGQNDTLKGFPKSTSEMMNKTTYTNWDFDSIWTIDEGTSYPYFLQNSNHAPVILTVENKTIQQNTFISLSMADVEASDADNDAMFLIVNTGMNYSLEGTTVTPVPNFVGELTVPVMVSDGIDTSNIKNIIISVNPMVSYNSINYNNEFLIYPVPTSGTIYMVNSGKFQNMYMVNSLGQVVLSYTNYIPNRLDVSNIPAGIYFIYVANKNENACRKVIIN